VTIFKYALLRNLRSPISYFSGLLAPVLLILASTNIWTNAPTAGLETLVMLMLLSSVLLVGLILEDRVDGSIMKILVSPVSMASYIFQNLLAAIIPFLIQILLLGILGLVRYNWTAQFATGAIIALFICAVATTAFAFCWNMLFRSKSGSRYSFMFVMAVIILLSGLFIPIEALPGFMRNVGAILHPYWFVRAITSLSRYGMNLHFWLYNSISLLYAIGFILLGGKGRRMQ